MPNQMVEFFRWLNSPHILRQWTFIIEFGYSYDVSTYSVKISLYMFNWRRIYQAFTAHIEFSTVNVVVYTQNVCV